MLLSTVKVLEVASVITGPYAGMILADLGAEVTKVEAPEGGDTFRNWRAGGEVSPTFAAYNHGKKSVALNLKSAEGREIYERLVRESHVVIENFRPGVMDRLGVGWDRLRAVNPRLVYCHITGVGSSGPERDRPVFDAVAQARSGLWSQLTDLSSPEPVGPPLADQLTAVYASTAVLAALNSVERTGRGTKVEVSMLSACLAFQPMGVAQLVSTGEVPNVMSRARQSQSYAFVGSDGLPFAVHLSTPQKFWEGLCRTVDRADLIDSEHYRTKGLRVQHYEALRTELAGEFAVATRETWLRRLAEQDVPAAPIYTLAEAVADPQTLATDMIYTHSQKGTDVGLVRSAVVADGQRCGADPDCTQFGADTSEVLQRLGTSVEKQDELRRRGVIA
jgi:crotonobetainyl-CoA:carnitine CoA-transferase CaiB-like acyl-CoA transferase